MAILLTNSLTRSKQALPEPSALTQPLGMYVCGPTVYNRPHIGNARSVVIYDVLFRLLRHTYGEDNVTYVRNITDVDDKINEAAKAENISIQALTQRTITEYHADISALRCLPPTIEPKATEHITQIIAMIALLLENGCAYIEQNHVLFDTTINARNHWHYGMLSGRTMDMQEAGARVAVEQYKRHPHDFVLWKPAASHDDASARFASPWGEGRPGWHIECSAMSTYHLGENFAIHGGGADLKFPHHENEIAQSCCAYPDSHYAQLWMHNGFLTVGGEKMSKSLGNFITVRALLDDGVRPEVIRLALLSAHYAKPLDWNDKLLQDCEKQLDKLYRKRDDAPQAEDTAENVAAILCDDMNLPAAIAALHKTPPQHLQHEGALLGLLQDDAWFDKASSPVHDEAMIQQQIALRIAAKAAKDWATADDIRNSLKAQHIELVDQPDGQTSWRVL